MILFALLLEACGFKNHENLVNETHKPKYNEDAIFNNYWYDNKAEITTYNLKQARYGEFHKGSAVVIFVTEDADQETHLKNSQKKDGDIPVLKMNLMKF